MGEGIKNVKERRLKSLYLADNSDGLPVYDISNPTIASAQASNWVLAIVENLGVSVWA
jgi:hypothetical protein